MCDWMPACSEIFQGPWFWSGVSHHLCWSSFSRFSLMHHFFIVYRSYILHCVGWIYCLTCDQASSSMLLSALSVCHALHIFFSFCFTRVFFCVCHYILCHLYYYLMLVSLDCTSCVCKVYLVCIVCCQVGVLCFGHVCGFNGICSVCFLFFALYFVFYLQFLCLNVFVLVLVWL